MSPQDQARVFLAMVLCGAGLGVVYDAMTLLRRGLRLGRVMTGALDICFGVACAAGIIVTALILRTDAYRLFVFAGTTLGFALYEGSVGTIVRYVSKSVHKCVKKC